MALRLGLGSRAGTAEQAIIDIGSNTVRLVIYGGPARAPAVLYNEKVTARLGKGVAEDGKLSEKAMGTVLAALGRFEALLRLRGVKKVQTVATAAARDASNGPAFLARVAALGLNPRLLSGEEEAVTSARGVLAAFPGAVCRTPGRPGRRTPPRTAGSWRNDPMPFPAPAALFFACPSR